MIKPLNAPQLSSAKQRTGLQSIGDLLPRLMRQYELQAQLMKQREEQARTPVVAMESAASGQTANSGQQATFGWFE